MKNEYIEVFKITKQNIMLFYEGKLYTNYYVICKIYHKEIKKNNLANNMAYHGPG